MNKSIIHDFITQKYHEEILQGLTTITTPKYPGNIALTGNSQAVLTCGDATKVILAASKYGHGKILATSHSYFYESTQCEDAERVLVAQNLIKWLTNGKDLKEINLKFALKA